MYTAHNSTAIKRQKNSDEQIFVCVWDGGVLATLVISGTVQQREYPYSWK